MTINHIVNEDNLNGREENIRQPLTTMQKFSAALIVATLVAFAAPVLANENYQPQQGQEYRTAPSYEVIHTN